MKLILILTTCTLFSFIQLTLAEETLGEKAKVTTNSMGRNTKKAMHRTSEALCGTLTGDNKVECLAKEAKNRMVEAKDSVKDKASELKNKADSDKK